MDPAQENKRLSAHSGTIWMELDALRASRDDIKEENRDAKLVIKCHSMHNPAKA